MELQRTSTPSRDRDRKIDSNAHVQKLSHYSASIEIKFPVVTDLKWSYARQVTQ
jgi:hypothetical protein